MAGVQCGCKHNMQENFSLVKVACSLNKLPENIPSPGTLQRYYLAKNEITSIDRGVFQHYSHLYLLDLESNRINRIHPTAFSGTIISTLILCNNNLICVPHFTSINNTLTHLYLDNNRLGECESPATICKSNFYRLEELNLYNNNLTYLPHIIYCTKRLKYLELQRNTFTTIPDLSNLLRRPYTDRHLRIYGNHWSVTVVPSG